MASGTVWHTADRWNVPPQGDGGKEGFMIGGCGNHRYFPFVSTHTRTRLKLYAGPWGAIKSAAVSEVTFLKHKLGEAGEAYLKRNRTCWKYQLHLPQ